MDPQELKWYTKQGPDGKWYKAQGASPEDAVGKMSKAWAPTQPAPAAPESSMWSKVGSYLPQATVGPTMQTVKKYAVDPFEKMYAKGSDIGGNAAESAATAVGFDKGGVPAGIARGVGETVGGLIADPRNWPMLGASEVRPVLQTIMKRGFGAMMAKGTLDYAKHLYDNWDKLTPGQRAEIGTQAGLSAAMTVGVAASKGEAAPRPEENPIAATGKTEAQVKTEAPTSSPKTGLAALSADEIRARLKAIEAKQKIIEAPKAVEPTPQQEAVDVKKLNDLRATAKPSTGTAKELSPSEQALWQESAFGQKPPEDIGKNVRAKNPEPTRAETKGPAPAPEAVPAEERAVKMTASQEIEQLRAQRDQKFQELQDRVQGMKEDLNYWETRKPIAASTEAAPGPDSTPLERKQYKARQRSAQAAEHQQLQSEIAARNAADLAKAQKDLNAIKAPGSSELGRDVAPPEATKPESKSVSTPEATQGSGEPVRPATKPPVDTSSEAIQAASKPIRDTAIMDRLAKEHPDWTLSQRLMAAAKEANPVLSEEVSPAAKASELGARPSKAPLPDLDTFQKAVAEHLKKHPNMAEGTAKRIVAERFAKERGSLSFSGDEPRDARRQAKIDFHLDVLRNPNSSPESLDSSYKMLTKVFDLSHDDIIQKMAGSPGFAETAPEKSAIEDRLGHDPVADAKADAIIGESTADWISKLSPEEKSAIREGFRTGKPDIIGVKSPAVEELERMHALRDERIKREGERGSLSFRRLTPAQQAAASPFRRLADALDRVAGFFEHRGLTDVEFAKQTEAANIIRGANAEKARSYLEVHEALKEAIERHDNPTNERDNFISFMDAGEGKPGAKFLNPEDQALSQELHRMFEERWEKIKDVKGLDGDGIENYLSHMWEKPSKAAQVLRGLVTGRRPLEGSTRFLKQRFYQYASEGVNHGLSPVTWNPIKLQLAALFNVDRFLMAHDIKDQFKDAGLAKWTKLSDYKNVPTGWARLDDKIFQPKLAGDGALKEYGTYYAPAEVAKIFNRYLSPGLKGVWSYDKVRSYANLLNMANLGLSAYHGTMISLVSATSDLSLGLQKVLNYGDFKSGPKDILRGTIGTFAMRSAAMDYKLGRSIQAEAIDPGGNTALQKYVDLITQSGGRFKQDPFYSNTMADRKGFVNWLRLAKAGKFTEMAQKGVQAASGPIMEKFVPRIKLGVAARAMEAKLQNLHDQGITNPNTIATEMGKIWDSVDNRAGQMVYDNLFWNKAAKDLSFLAVRAVGWDLGSAREYGGGALIDTPRQLAKLLRGQRPELTSRMAFSIATPITIGLFGGVVHYLMTGKAPDHPEDYFFPGNAGEKVSFPSYVKDIASFRRQPLQTAINKLNPVWGQIVEFHQNADFYGTEIRHEGDPAFKQGLEIMKWYAKNWEPYGISGTLNRVERGEPWQSAVTGFAGFMPAPKWVEQTKAEELADTLDKRNWHQGPRTTADTERYTLVKKFQRQVGSGTLNMNELTKAWQDKKIQDTDIAKIYGSHNLPRLQQDFKDLPLPDALAVMREADPNERVQLKPLLLDKYGQLNKYPLDEQQTYDKQIREYLQ